MTNEANEMIVNDIITAIMPDGTAISSRAKAEAILTHLGINDCPPCFVHLVATGVGQKLRSIRRLHNRD